MDEEKKTKTSSVKKKTEISKTPKKTTTTKKTGSASSKKTTEKKGTSTTSKGSTSKKSVVKNESAKKTTAKKAEVKKTESKKVEGKKTTTKKSTASSKPTVKPKKEVIQTVPEKKEVVRSKKVLEEIEVISEEPIFHEEKKVIEKPKEEPIFETRKTIKKIIPVSNYLIAAIIVVWVIIIAYVGFELSRRHQENLYQEGYFIHEKIDIKKISLEEAKNVARDSIDATFILFNYRGYKETYQLEHDLLKILQDYHLEQNFYYVDLTDETGTLNCDMTCVINTSMNVDKFKNVPAIAYYGRGSLVDIAQRDDQKVLEVADFVKLLDMYEFRK